MTKILIVSEAIPHPNKGGASQTLYNILKYAAASDLKVYIPTTAESSTKLVEPFTSNVIFANLGFPIRLPSRIPFHRLLNWLIARLDMFIKNVQSLPNAEKLQAFNPDIVLFCPLGPVALTVFDKMHVLLKKPTIVYFMDDWPVGKEQSFDRKIKSMLDAATGHIFISDYLKSSMQARLGFVNKPFRIMHNPIDLNEITHSNISIQRQGTFRIVYAGSLWGIQLQAVMQMAEAVGSLRKQGVDVAFSLYTNQGFWDQNKHFWAQNEVEYKGWIPYSELKQELKSADLLLVASSFLPEFKNLTIGSLQTKVTDYLAACRPVLCLGPSYAANNLFVKKWACGLVFESPSPAELALFISQLILERNNHEAMIRRGVKQLEEKLNTDIIHKSVKEFLKEISDLT